MDKELARVLAGMDPRKYADLLAEVEAERAARLPRISDNWHLPHDDAMSIPGDRRPEDRPGADSWRQLPKPWRPNPSVETGAGRLPNGISEHIVAALLAKANRNL